LIRDTYLLAGREIAADSIGEPVLGAIADISLCDRAAFLIEDPAKSGRFRVEHAIGLAVGAVVEIGEPPPFMFTATGIVPDPAAAPLSALLGVPHLLWAFDAGSRRALVLGSLTESNIHRAFEPGDQELVEGALSVYVDVQLRKLAEATLRQAKTAAEEANEARARFLATLTHELRTPLNAIIGFSELLIEDGARQSTPIERREFASEILSAGGALLRLVNDILDYSSLSHAAPRLQRGWVPASQLLAAIGRAFKAEAAARPIALVIELPEPDLELLIDYDRFRQILNNLVGNAIKFTDPGGTVTIGATMSNETCVIEVTDTGIGMSAKDIPRALEPFIQIDNQSHRRFRGTGLGLPIARQLSEAHGGALRIDSAPGQGTRARVLLTPDCVRAT
jgi:signal transduction histidine kinase